LRALEHGPDGSTLPAEAQAVLVDGTEMFGRLVERERLPEWRIVLDEVETETGLSLRNVVMLHPASDVSETITVEGEPVTVHAAYSSLTLGTGLAEDRQTHEWHPGGTKSICSLRASLPGMNTPDVTLNRQPTPDDTFLHIDVREIDCVDGRSAEGRIRHDVILDDETVTILVGYVRPPGESFTCPGNPQAPTYVIDLGEPLGDRAIMDASFLPDRPL
jgi:hypothetical protein